jgi:transposase
VVRGRDGISETVTLTVADIAASARQDGQVASRRSPRAGQPKRRTFTADYKLAILQQYEQLEDPRERGGLLRREGLYHSHIEYWREARDKGVLRALSDKSGRQPARDEAKAENEKLRKENERLTTELARTKAALEVVGKAYALLELLSESAEPGRKPRT